MLSNFRILSIDPGTNFTGTSILDIDLNNDIKLKFVETIKAVNLAKKNNSILHVYGSRFTRIHVTGQQITKLLLEYNPDAVISESPYLGKFPQSFAALTEILSEFRRRTFAYNVSVPFITIDPSTVKKSLGVKGTSGDKKLMRKAIEKIKFKNSDYSNYNLLDEHSIDAIAVGLWYLKEMY